MITIKTNKIGKHARDIVDALTNKPIQSINILYNKHDIITGIRLYFVDRMLSIEQNLEPIDDEEEHDENPLDFEFQEEDT